MTLEKRLELIKGFYFKLEDIIDRLPKSVPQKLKDSLRSLLLGNNDLRELMEGVESRRLPRLLIVGRTGMGKSSLINALCSGYVAEVSDVESCTSGASTYICKDGERGLLEIMDTRGTAETIATGDGSAESVLVEDVNSFIPDALLFMLSCSRRDDINEDVDLVKVIKKNFERVHHVELPVIVVLNKADEAQPSREKLPSEYSDIKINNIESIIKYYKGIIINRGLKINEIIAVSSYMEWQTSDGIAVSAENINNLPDSDKDALQIGFDGRYRINELLDVLEANVCDFEAKMGLRMALKQDELINKTAMHYINAFSTFAATVAFTPIPIADIIVLTTLQAILVTIIALLGGIELDIEGAKAFITSFGGLGGAALGLREIARTLVKFVPVGGTAISAGVAGLGTRGIGLAAKAFYIDGEDIKKVKAEYKKFINKNKKNHELQKL